MQAEVGTTTIETARSEHRALWVAAWVAVAVVLWLTKPVGWGVLLGVLFAVTFRPLQLRLARRLPPAFAALATVLASTLGAALTFAALAWVLVRDGFLVGRTVVASLDSGGGAQRIVAGVSHVTSKLGIGEGELHDRTRAIAKEGVKLAAVVLEKVGATTGRMVLSVFFSMLTMYFFLRRWERIVASVEVLLPLRRDYTLQLLDEFRRVGRQTLIGTVVNGLLQGALAAVGYAVAGLPYPLFLGVVTAIASLIPGIGTLLVWVPATIGLAVTGHLSAALGLLVYCVVVVTGIPTYVILPRIAGRGGAVPALFMFISLFGGSALLGLKGLIIGPVLMTLAAAVLRIYAAEARARRPTKESPSL